MAVCANPECNKEFISVDKKQIYCCRTCAQIMSTHFRKERNNQKHVNKKCLICKKEFEWKPSKKYCCKTCAKQAIKLQNKQWQDNNIEHAKELKREWNNKNRKHLNNYEKEKKQNNANYKLSKILRVRIINAIKNQSSQKAMNSINLLGCSIQECRDYLESKFQEGMTWENHGLYGWHIDHKIPCDAFDLTILEEQQKCFHYSNLQPLWAEDNLRKSNKLIGRKDGSYI